MLTHRIKRPSFQAGAKPAGESIMNVSPVLSCVIGLILAAAVAVQSQADLVGQWDVGEGSSTASIQFDFLDGQTFLFDLSWDGDLTGREAFDLLAGDDTGRFFFEFDYIAYSFGDFLTGVGIEDSYDYGEGSPPDYADTWKYWTAEGDGLWESSMIGFSDRILTDGSRDAWVFGNYDPPAQIPAPATLALLGLVPMSRRRRR
jgi:hypothetical protein